ncbi:hypothetical protein B7463_g10969, partial [Scytalidium lignicola]
MIIIRPLSAVVLGVALTAQVNAAAQSPWSYKEKQFKQTFYDGYSVLKHYGGNGPYSDREAYGISRDPPAGCAVDQVIMLKRHGERYPDPSIGANFEHSLSKVYRANSTFKNDLEFLNSWTYWLPAESYYAEETFSGPYAGLLSGYTHGTEYRARYGHLWDGVSKVPMFSSGYERIIETARKFGEGFFGYNYTEIVGLNIINENATQGADSLTPTCVHDNDTATCGNLTNILPEFYVAAKRLNSLAPGMNLNVTDIYNLMQMAAFELNARPFSPWIDVFTLDEWASFGYTQDLQYYYCNGPGDRNMKAVGNVYVNASLVLLNKGPSIGKIWFNFCHDTNITPVIAALGIVTPSKHLPTDQVAWGNPWSTGNIVPMSGHIVLERLSCNATAISPKGTFVRAVLNEAVVPFPTCQNGPGYSCPLADYNKLMSSLPSFIKSCGIPPNYPQYLDFWFNYNLTNTLDYQNGSIPFQQGLTTD